MFYKTRTLSRLTGFAPALLRAWETRHGLLAPTRAPGGHRVYGTDDLHILERVRELIGEGRSIGEIALLGRDRLLVGNRAAVHVASVASVRATPVDGPVEASPLLPAARAFARMKPVQIVQILCDTLAEDYDSALARVWFFDAPHYRLHLMASAGLTREIAKSSRRVIDLNKYAFKIGEVVKNLRPFASDQLQGDVQFDQRWLEREHITSAMILPLIAKARLLAVLACFFRKPLEAETTTAVETLAMMASASIAGRPELPRSNRQLGLPRDSG